MAAHRNRIDERRRYYLKHRDSILVKAKQYRDEHPDKLKAYNLERYYGLSLEQFEQLAKAQNYRCAICDIHEKDLTRRLDVDHNHATGKVRGLLCSRCNTQLIVTLERYAHLIDKAMSYLRRYDA